MGVMRGCSLCAVLWLAACGDPQTRCREGVEQMKAQLVGVVGSSEHKDLEDPMVQAHTQLDIAQTQLATGNHAGCLESLERARDIIERAKK